MTVWLRRQFVVAVHDEQLAEHGGAPGIRDENLPEGALARPLNRAGYSDPDIAELAALYALGVARNHPFVDGNKRTAFASMVAFLSLNGAPLMADEVDAVITMLGMAAGDISDDEFIAWVRGHVALGAAPQTNDSPASSA